MTKVYTTPIACPNVERVSYIIYSHEITGKNKCVGRFIEQENDAGEVQYLFIINWSVITKEDSEWLLIPGIDLLQYKKVYVRSYNVPFYLEGKTIPHFRGDYLPKRKRIQLEYDDDFEWMLRYRGITHYSNCYVGRYPEDFIDRERAMWDIPYGSSLIPNLDIREDNEFHKMDQDKYNKLIPYMEKSYGGYTTDLRKDIDY